MEAKYARKSRQEIQIGGLFYTLCDGQSHNSFNGKRERSGGEIVTEPRKGHFFSNIYQKRNRNKKN